MATDRDICHSFLKSAHDLVHVLNQMERDSRNLRRLNEAREIGGDQSHLDRLLRELQQDLQRVRNRSQLISRLIPNL